MTYWSVEETDGLVVAAYVNPPMNYFVAPAVEELAGLLADWHRPEVRAVILTGGVPGRFITHYSVEELLALAEDSSADPSAISRGYHDFVLSFRELPKPVIVAMTGDTMGGGLELSLNADIRIAAAGNWRIGLPEVRLGILPGGTGTQHLARLLGTAAAAEFILRGRVVTPAEAQAMGLIHEVAADPVARAREIAAELMASPAVALAQAKRAIYAGADLPLRQGCALEAEAFGVTMASPEGKARMRAYAALPFDQRGL
ncbi:MAG: enoyl-CoA hydratase/isomerase family protein [Thermohalobaculum sp.]